MLMQCLSAVCVLGVVMVGLLVMLQIVSLEELGHGLRQCFLLLVLVLVTLCLLRVVLLPMLACGLVWLKGVMLKTVVIVLAIIAVVSLLRMLLKLALRSTDGKHHREKL